MKRFKRIRYLLCLMSIVGALGVLLGSQVVLAAQESANPPLPPQPNDEEPAEELIEESLELVSRFPVKQGEAGESFDFEVSFNYQGTEPKVFEFAVSPPSGWEITIARYISEETQATLLAMMVSPNLAYPTSIHIKLSPLPGNTPEPGEHVLIFEAASGDLRDSIELKAVINELPLTYELAFTTTTGRLDFPVKGGEGNPISFNVTNTGTGDITNVSFSSVKSEGWGTTFTPGLTEILKPGESIEAEMIMTPPRNTIAGDYRIYARAAANSPDVKLQEQLDLRIRVQTPTVWGAAGIGIVVAVIAALAVMFRQLGRR
jgi:uncharacterized membrane protein